MERLRVELRRKGDDLLPRHGVRPEGKFLAGLEIFEIAQRHTLKTFPREE